MVNDKIVYLVFFAISIVIVSGVAHMDNSKSITSAEHGLDTENTSQGNPENETGTILFMLENDEDSETNDGA